MKKNEKLAKYMAQGLTMEQAERLITYNQNDYLSLEELAMKYDVMSIPTIMIFENGTLLKTFIGVTDKNNILEQLK